jgi:hypothetical protein
MVIYRIQVFQLDLIKGNPLDLDMFHNKLLLNTAEHSLYLTL